MRYFDEDEAAKIKAFPWQLELLSLNPGYCSWGPHEDYMAKDGNGWDSRQLFGSWQAFGPWGLDDLNEVVNFYFEINRSSEECKVCDGNGYHEKAQEVVNTFYPHMNNRGIRWSDKITQDELDALISAGRFKPGTFLDDVNAANRPGARGLGHDAINRHILTKARLKRLGLPVHCDCCGGDGYVYIAPEASVSLVLWFLHPRKGCSRGVEVGNITQEDLPVIYAYLREAAQRNADRFKAIPPCPAAT